MTSLLGAVPGTEYRIKSIDAEDEEMKSFLFTLGCYSGERITVVARKKQNLVISVKDARYNIDSDLAGTIMI